jgi:hypothetical protein
VPMRTWRRLVPIVLLAEAADPTDRGHALISGAEAAIISGISCVINRAPRIALGVGKRANRSRSDDYS